MRRTPLTRALLAEAIGTFALVFDGAGAIIVHAKTHALGRAGVAITFGLVRSVKQPQSRSAARSPSTRCSAAPSPAPR